MAYHLKNKKNNKLVEKRGSEFKTLGKTFNPGNLIYNYKTEGRSERDFGNYQNLIELFTTLKDGKINWYQHNHYKSVSD